MIDFIVIRRFLAIGMLALAACAADSDGPDRAEPAGDPASLAPEAPASPAPAEAARPANAAPASTDTLPPFSQRIVLFIEASAAELDAIRASRGEEDYHTMADDLMWYRATAREFLENNGLPVRALEGRQPLRFVVNGGVTSFDYSHIPTLDVVILYDTNREPVAAAPIDIEEATRAYFR